ncbi:MAG: holo-ACP synthase [Limnochordia bacterium]
MIYGIGIDIIEIARIARLLSQFPQRFPTRICSPRELDYIGADVAKLAGRFAAKEAVMKAMGTGWTGGVAFREIEIIPGLRGEPEVHLSGRTGAVAQGLGIAQVLISISHGREAAIAQAVALRGVN